MSSCVKGMRPAAVALRQVGQIAVNAHVSVVFALE
jgi:hypothetical protein